MECLTYQLVLNSLKTFWSQSLYAMMIANGRDWPPSIRTLFRFYRSILIYFCTKVPHLMKMCPNDYSHTLKSKLYSLVLSRSIFTPFPLYKGVIYLLKLKKCRISLKKAARMRIFRITHVKTNCNMQPWTEE